jgi:hypothetical protein
MAVMEGQAVAVRVMGQHQRAGLVTRQALRHHKEIMVAVVQMGLHHIPLAVVAVLLLLVEMALEAQQALAALALQVVLQALVLPMLVVAVAVMLLTLAQQEQAVLAVAVMAQLTAMALLAQPILVVEAVVLVTIQT